jgi:nitric oxide reductase subunit B
MAMALFSLAPVALLQVKAAVEHGFWFARSPEFLYSPLIQTLVWLRIPGDVAFSAGAIILALWAVKLLFAPKQAKLTAADGAVREAG